MIIVIAEKVGSCLADRFLTILGHEKFVLEDIPAATGDFLQHERVSAKKDIENGICDRGFERMFLSNLCLSRPFPEDAYSGSCEGLLTTTAKG